MQLKDTVRAFRWVSSKSCKKLLILDQLKLPQQENWISCCTPAEVANCIRKMQIRGAPAIGCVAAYGMALACGQKNFKNLNELLRHLKAAKDLLASARPTAVNLFWALERMLRIAQSRISGLSWKKKLSQDDFKVLTELMEAEANRIVQEDLHANYQMGILGAALLPIHSVVLTHCNTGSLATSGWGTALGVIRTAYQKGKIKKVLVDETRPYLQGARLTAWELKKDGIPHELITDNMAAHLMKTEKVSAVIVGSDRIAANGDVANKIGTYNLAILCKYHKVPFYVAAPTSTLDLSLPSGKKIPIEERDAKEVTHIKNFPIAPEKTPARHPAFDVTPNFLIRAIVTEKGVARSPFAHSLKTFLNHSSTL